MMLRTASGLVEVRPYLRTASGLVVCDSSVFRMASGTVNIGGASQMLTAVTSPEYVAGAVSRPGNSTVYTNATTVTVTGGSAPFSYAWSKTDGDVMAITSPTAASTTFNANVLPGNTRDASFACVVTDSRGATASAFVGATISNSGGGNAEL